MSSATQPFSPPAQGPLQAPEAAQFSESPQKRSWGAVHQQPSRKKHAKRTLPSRGQKERKDAAELPSSPIPSWPSGEGMKPPNKATSTVERGLSRTLAPFLGEPHPQLGRSFTRELRGLACKDEGCRSREHSPPDPTPPSLTNFSSGFFP